MNVIGLISQLIIIETLRLTIPTCAYAAKIYRGAHDMELQHSQHEIV